MGLNVVYVVIGMLEIWKMTNVTKVTKYLQIACCEDFQFNELIDLSLHLCFLIKSTVIF